MIIRLLSYLKKVEKMNDHCWSKMVVEERLDCRKKAWMKQNMKWLSKWDINLQTCPDTNEEIKRCVVEKFTVAMWTKQIGQKKNTILKCSTQHGSMMKKFTCGWQLKVRLQC